MKLDDEELWTAIADPSRRHVLEALLVRDNITQSELASSLPFSRQALAKHLVVLERTGLIESARQGREVRYTVCSARVAEASQVMARLAQRWDQRLNKIKAIAETIHRERHQ